MKKPTRNHVIIDARGRKAGVGRPVTAFLNYISDHDNLNDYTVLVEPSDDFSLNLKHIQVKKCKYKRFSMNPIDQIGFSWQLYRLKPDVVYFSMTGIAPLLYFGKNVTFTHDLTMLRFARAGKLPGWLHFIRMLGYRLLFWKGNKFTNHIIVPSKFVKSDLNRYMASTKNKTTVIYESGDLPSQVKVSKPTQINKPFIFHAGSPFPHKNIKNLVLAFEKLKQKQPELQLVLAGKKEYYFEQLEMWLVSRKYSRDIIIPGFISDGELKWLFQNAECYVLPSLSEGFGLPGLEAMAHKCPLVSSNATCLPEIYEESAIYFDPLNIDDMAQAISLVLSDKNIRKKLLINSEKTLSKYSWNKMSKEILNVINSTTEIK